jgi:UDP-3-O-[3-hydroxymyristoyl] N-acetylglucosamine deacetylase
VEAPAAVEQRTLRDACCFEGIGLHTGEDARVRLVPQPAGTGIVFRLDGAVTFPAHAEYVVDTSRATVVGAAGARVSTVEHLLSALMGACVDNVLIDVHGPEIPVADGSAAPFLDEIERIGTQAQGAPRREFVLPGPRAYREGDALVMLAPADAWRVRFVADFPAPVGTHYFDGEIEPRAYRERVARARTFGYLHEVEALIARGLARGGSLDNALVFGDEGPLTPLRLPGEVVAHKVLDLVGDFALLGARPRFEVVAVKSGHRLHTRVVNDLRSSAASGLAS